MHICHMSTPPPLWIHCAPGVLTCAAAIVIAGAEQVAALHVSWSHTGKVLRKYATAIRTSKQFLFAHNAYLLTKFLAVAIFYCHNFYLFRIVFHALVGVCAGVGSHARLSSAAPIVVCHTTT